MQANVDHSELTRLAERLEKSPQVLAEAKRQGMEAAAPKLKAAVQTKIGGSGRVRSWQESCVGSGGGYAAVRPRKKTYAEARGLQLYDTPSKEKPKRYAVGYLTNAINNGHRTPKNKWGYRTSAKVIAGKQYYQQAQTQGAQIAQETAEQIFQTVKDHLEG